MSDYEVSLMCDCGRELEVRDERVGCRCGAVYAVTVTQIQEPEDG